MQRVIRAIDPGVCGRSPTRGEKLTASNMTSSTGAKRKPPNAIWQADHTLARHPCARRARQVRPRPWLTVMINGTAGRWPAISCRRTPLPPCRPPWHSARRSGARPNLSGRVCGIHGVLYTDHGSDFISGHIERVRRPQDSGRSSPSRAGPGRGGWNAFRTVNQRLLARCPATRRREGRASRPFPGPPSSPLPNSMPR